LLFLLFVATMYYIGGFMFILPIALFCLVVLLFLFKWLTPLAFNENGNVDEFATREKQVVRGSVFFWGTFAFFAIMLAIF